MPGEIFGELGAGLIRIAGRVLAEIFLHIFGEVIIQGMGYLICRPFKPDVNPDGRLAAVVGFAFWLMAAMLGYLALDTFS
jgi:hypothetical protein